MFKLGYGLCSPHLNIYATLFFLTANLLGIFFGEFSALFLCAPRKMLTNHPILFAYYPQLLVDPKLALCEFFSVCVPSKRPP